MASVVIAGDVPLLRSLMRMAIEDSGHDVIEELDDANSLLAYASSTKEFDIIIMDLHLDEIKCVRVIESILDIKIHASIIIISDFLLSFEQKALSAGARAFLKKPFSIYDLVDILRKSTPIC